LCRPWGRDEGYRPGRKERKGGKAPHLAHGRTSFSFTLTFFHSAHPCSWKRTMGQGKGPRVHCPTGRVTSRLIFPFVCTLAFSIPILCLLIHMHHAFRSVPRKRILDQYLFVFAIQGACLCSLFFCSLLTFTPQRNTQAGQGGVVLHCRGSVSPCRALTRKSILDQYPCVLALCGVCLCSTSLHPIDDYTEKYTRREGWRSASCIAWVLSGSCRGTHANHFAERQRPAQHAA
jgi:hypothetical protein